jgi:hypothetical protein
MSDLWDDLFLPLLIILGSIFGVLAVVIAIAMHFAAIGCEVRGNAMGLPSQWGFYTDCMVQVDGKWIPLDKYRITRIGD